MTQNNDEDSLRDVSITARSVNVPSTEADDQDTGSFPVLPGTLGYEAVAERLRNGELSYSQFTVLLRDPASPSVQELRAAIERLRRSIEKTNERALTTEATG